MVTAAFLSAHQCRGTPAPWEGLGTLNLGVQQRQNPCKKANVLILSGPDTLGMSVTSIWYDRHTDSPDIASFLCPRAYIFFFSANLYIRLFCLHGVLLFSMPQTLGPEPLPRAGVSPGRRGLKKRCCPHESKLLAVYRCRKTTILFLQPKPCKEPMCT